MNFVKIDSSKLDALKRRVVKFLRYGKSDVQESVESSPYGIDSVPIKQTIAVFSETETKGKSVIIGYLNVERKSEEGEIRLFSTDENGAEKTYLWLKKNGTIEINGDSDNAVRYSKLEQAFNELKQDFNNHVNNWNAFSAAYIPGSPSTLGTPPTAQVSQSSSADISPSKIDEIKVP